VEEHERFAKKFMLSEFNKTKAEENGGAPSRFTKLRPEICNIHLLWKILAPNVLRRRKQDIQLTREELKRIGMAECKPVKAIVQKVRHVKFAP
jgi:hypothetical protein